MENYREFRGKDLADALERAAKELDRPERELEYEVVSEGRRGWFLGVGGREICIRVRMARPAAYETPPEEGNVEILESMVGDMLRGMQLDVRCQVRQEGEYLRVNLAGPDRQFLLDPKGEILDAIQFLLGRMSRRSFPEAIRIVVDSDGFRQQRDEEIVRLAREAAARVRRDGEPVRTPPLNPYERRLVHTALRGEAGLVTRSIGDGFLKRVSILPARGDPGGGRGPGDGPGGDRGRRSP